VLQLIHLDVHCVEMNSVTTVGPCSSCCGIKYFVYDMVYIISELFLLCVVVVWIVSGFIFLLCYFACGGFTIPLCFHCTDFVLCMLSL
jgi:hypothetical protein